MHGLNQDRARTRGRLSRRRFKGEKTAAGLIHEGPVPEDLITQLTRWPFDAHA
jgi:hypothetical protein